MPVFSQKFIGVTLPMRLGQSGYFDSSLDIIQQTRSNVKNLVLTKKGERLNQPNLGCDVWKILFEQLTPDTIERARISVVEAFSSYLPYLEVVDFRVQQLVTDENIFNVQIVYRFLNNPNVVDSVEIDRLNTSLTSVSTVATDTITTRELYNGQVIRSGVRGAASVPPGSIGQ